MADPQAVIRALFDRVAVKDLAGAASMFAQDAVFIDAAGPDVLEGRPAIRQMIAEMWEGLPDVRVEVIAMVGDGSTVMTEIELIGTHLGPYLACPPTGATIRWRGASRYEVDPANGEIVHESFFYDPAGLLSQLRPDLRSDLRPD
jgi:steroid delta-isomerase-like uncharacterized protein